MRYAQLVMGPAGSGKSTYCSNVQKHGESTRRSIHVINLDPAAEYFEYQPTLDIRDLIQLSDAMEDEDLMFGPNGGLVFCMEYLSKNMSWLEEELGEGEDDYYLIDCPGQIELYSHLSVMRTLVDQLQEWNFRVCGVFLLDANFMLENAKFISGTMTALAAMVNLNIPHVNVLTKMDLLSKASKKQIEKFLVPDSEELLGSLNTRTAWDQRHAKLTEALGKVMDDYSLVHYFPLDISDDDSIGDLLLTIDNCIQYGEDLEPKMKDFDPPEDDDD